MVYEVGDVVSLLDYSGGIYFAMIRGFLVDQYANQMAVLTWLLPKTPNPQFFDPNLFILGKSLLPCSEKFSRGPILWLIGKACKIKRVE